MLPVATCLALWETGTYIIRFIQLLFAHNRRPSSWSGNVDFSVFHERLYSVHSLNPGPRMVRKPRPEQHIRRNHMSNRRQTDTLIGNVMNNYPTLVACVHGTCPMIDLCHSPYSSPSMLLSLWTQKVRFGEIIRHNFSNNALRVTMNDGKLVFEIRGNG